MYDVMAAVWVVAVGGGSGSMEISNRSAKQKKRKMRMAGACVHACVRAMRACTASSLLFNFFKQQHQHDKFIDVHTFMDSIVEPHVIAVTYHFATFINGCFSMTSTDRASQ